MHPTHHMASYLEPAHLGLVAERLLPMSQLLPVSGEPMTYCPLLTPRQVYFATCHKCSSCLYTWQATPMTASSTVDGHLHCQTSALAPYIPGHNQHVDYQYSWACQLSCLPVDNLGHLPRTTTITIVRSCLDVALQLCGRFGAEQFLLRPRQEEHHMNQLVMLLACSAVIILGTKAFLSLRTVSDCMQQQAGQQAGAGSQWLPLRLALLLHKYGARGR